MFDQTAVDFLIGEVEDAFFMGLPSILLEFKKFSKKESEVVEQFKTQCKYPIETSIIGKKLTVNLIYKTK